MGWGRMLLLGDLGQQMDIEEHRDNLRKLARENSRLRQAGDSQVSRLARLEQENDELKLYLASIVRLLVGKKVFSKEEFARVVELVDASDGAADGKFGGEVGG